MLADAIAMILILVLLGPNCMIAAASTVRISKASTIIKVIQGHSNDIETRANL